MFDTPLPGSSKTVWSHNMVPGTEWNWNSWRNVKFQKDGGSQVSQIRPAGKSKVLDLLNSVTRKARGNSVCLCVQPSNMMVCPSYLFFFLKIQILFAFLDTKRISWRITFSHLAIRSHRRMAPLMLRPMTAKEVSANGQPTRARWAHGNCWLLESNDSGGPPPVVTEPI